MSTEASIRFLEDLAGGPLTLGRLMLAIREGEQMSQTAFAKQLKLSRANLCDIEKGRRLLSIKKAREFAQMLGYSERQFVRLAIQDQLRSEGLDYNVRLSA